MPVVHWSGDVVVLAGFSSLAALEVVNMITFSAAGGGGLVGVVEFPLQCQWICTVIIFYPAPTVGRSSNGLRCLILLIYHMCLIFMYKFFYILVSLVSVLLRPTTILPWPILSVPMCIDVIMCMLMLLFYVSYGMLALNVSIKFLLTIYIDYKCPAFDWPKQASCKASWMAPSRRWISWCPVDVLKGVS